MKINASSAWESSYLSVMGPKNRWCQGAVKNSMLIEWVSAPSMVGQRKASMAMVLWEI